MGRVLTNNSSFRYALEGTETVGSRGIGFLPGEDPGDGGGSIAGSPSWKDIEPNEIPQFGSSIETVSRNPIRTSRGRQKGTISDLDSAVELDADLTLDSFLDFAEAMCFATFNNVDLVFLGSNADTTGDTYAVSALTSTQADKLQVSASVNSLLYARGYSNAANNGIKTLATDASSSDTSLAVSENLVTETAPANARLEIGGAEFADGVMSLTVAAAVNGVSGRIGTLDMSPVSPASLGLEVNQVIFVKLTSVIEGYARIKEVGATSLTLDRMSSALVDSAPTGDTTQIRFGQSVRDFPTSSSRFLERSYQFEAQYPGLAADGVSDAYEYARGNFLSTIAISADLADKTLISLGFIGTDTDTPTESRKTNASSSRAAQGTEAFSTVADFARLVINDIDEDSLTSDVKTVELSVNNNVSPEKVLNNLGAKFVNFGNFEVDLSMQIIFSDANVLSRIRNNTTVGMDLFFANNDGTIAFSIPSMTLGDGSKDLPVNETVLLNLTGEAFEDTVTGASLAVSYIPSVV